MSKQTKPSIVFVHGLWADGSCFSKLIQPLQAEGYEVMASQHSLDSVKGDVAAVKRTLGRVSSPAILVGHSYGVPSSRLPEPIPVLRDSSTSPHSHRMPTKHRRVCRPSFPSRTFFRISKSRTIVSG